MKSYFNFAIAFDERSLQNTFSENTHIFYSLSLYPIVVSNCVLPLSRLSQISLNVKIRNVCEKNVLVVYASSVRNDSSAPGWRAAGAVIEKDDVII